MLRFSPRTDLYSPLFFLKVPCSATCQKKDIHKDTTTKRGNPFLWSCPAQPIFGPSKKQGLPFCLLEYSLFCTSAVQTEKGQRGANNYEDATLSRLLSRRRRQARRRGTRVPSPTPPAPPPSTPLPRTLGSPSPHGPLFYLSPSLLFWCFARSA